MAQNKTLLQTFEWHTPSSPSATSHYSHLTRLLPFFSSIGTTALWLPPGCKANNPQGNGYDCYDLWDLGEFDQKGSRSTKWGSREELDELILKAKEERMEIIWDAVLNHKQGGDDTVHTWAVEVDKDDRRYEISTPKQIEVWLRYEFHGREREGMKYSGMEWRPEHFNGVDWDQRAEKHAIYKLIDDPATLTEPFIQPKRPVQVRTPSMGRRLASLSRRWTSSVHTTKSIPAPKRRPGKGWAEDVDSDHGNNDYLLFSNIDYSHPEVREDVMNWASWMLRDIGVDGFRLDAVQHFSYRFTKGWIQQANEVSKHKAHKDVFVVGEVWAGEVNRLTKWLDAVQDPSGPQVYAYDAPLLYNFSRISEDVRKGSKNADLRTITRDSLLQRRPEAAVTLVTNHDTQPGQTCYTPMLAELKVLWYAFILLIEHGLPCVFWGDVFGTNGPLAEPPACVVSDSKGQKSNMLLDLILCRKLFAYGPQTFYLDSALCIGWTRAGTSDRPGCAVLMSILSTTKMTTKDMKIGQPGEVWIDVLGRVKDEVKIDATGSGAFRCAGVSVSVFVRKNAEVLHRLPVRLDDMAEL